MYIPIVPTILTVMIDVALSIPFNPSSSTVSLNTSSSPNVPENGKLIRLESWPLTPWTLNYGMNAITFQQYGRNVAQDLEYETFTSIQSIYEQVVQGPLPGEYSHILQGGIVTFYIIFSGQEKMTRDQIARLLVEIQVLFLNNMNGPQEILVADVKIGSAREHIALFQVMFSRVTMTTDT